MGNGAMPTVLRDFTSDDRYTGSPDGKTFRQQRWSTRCTTTRPSTGRKATGSRLGRRARQPCAGQA
jgi:hypothetical protein